MSSSVDPLGRAVRITQPDDAASVAHLLHDFNEEFGDPTPPVAQLGERLQRLLSEGEITVLLGGDGPDGLALLRFRPSIWTQALECYLAELYVVPPRRGHGLGRELMRAAIACARARGADHIELGTAETDVAARALYESLGFSNREGKPEGPVNYYYELEL